MNFKPTTSASAWKAMELRKLPPKQRDAILAAAAFDADELYRTDSRLTDFQDFGEDDLHGDSTATPMG